ncbi:MAG TPA: HAD family phosphatase [Alloiococcus sp.]|nr:HAD family phosphatase [Alloiococcus sp.]
MTFKAIIFDMDGLMFDTEAIYYKANQKTADDIGLPFTKDFYLKYVGASDKDFFAGMYKEFDEKEKIDRFVDESNAIAHEMLTAGHIDKKKGLIDLLDFIKEKELEAVIASSSEKWLVETITTNNDVREYFIDTVGGDEVKHAKPSPDIFLKALEKLDTKKEETLVLEDSLNGVRAAYEAGIPVIMIPDLLKPDKEAHEKAYAVLDNLSEVKKYLN